jgi:hypothetical protein
LKEACTYVDSVGSLFDYVGDGTHSPRGKHDLVVIDKRVLVDGTEDITTGDVVADLELGGVKVP